MDCDTTKINEYVKDEGTYYVLRNQYTQISSTSVCHYTIYIGYDCTWKLLYYTFVALYLYYLSTIICWYAEKWFIELRRQHYFLKISPK